MARVLLVDDDPDQLDLRSRIVSHHGHTVWIAGTAQEAERAFLENTPDAVVMDLRIPDLANGLALIRTFRASPAFGGRILVLSGFPNDLRGTAEESLVDHVLTKPTRTEVLLGLLAA